MDALPVLDLQTLGGGGIAVAMVWVVLSFLKNRNGRNGNGVEQRLDTMIEQLEKLNDKFDEFWREMLRRGD